MNFKLLLCFGVTAARKPEETCKEGCLLLWTLQWSGFWFFFTCTTNPNTWDLRLHAHLKDKAIKVKYLAQGHKCHNQKARAHTLLLRNARAWVLCNYPLGHDTPPIQLQPGGLSIQSFSHHNNNTAQSFLDWGRILLNNPREFALNGVLWRGGGELNWIHCPDANKRQECTYVSMNKPRWIPCTVWKKGMATPNRTLQVSSNHYFNDQTLVYK